MLSYLRQAAMSPLWLAELGTGAKSFEANPILGSRWLNERGLHGARLQIAHRIAAWRRRHLEHLVPAEDRAAYERDGLVVRRNFLPEADFQALLAEAKAYRGRYREMRQGDTINRKIAPDRATLSAMPTLRKVIESPAWQGLLRYIGSRDTEPGAFIESVFRHACDGPDDPQTFLHADTFHPTSKAWLYLTDVADDGGAFTFVPGSHRLTPARQAWERETSLSARHAAERYTREGSFRIEQDSLADLELPQPRAFGVPANTLIVADTFGFHARGPSVRPTQRVEIFGYGRRCPFLPWTGLDAWTGAGLASRMRLLWTMRDLAEAAGLKKNFMRLKPGVSCFDAP